MHRFNPRTHTACDEWHLSQFRNICVSIHARTRRATIFFNFVSRFDFVSIHARTRRATGEPGATHASAAFQSTHAHGVRHKLKLRFGRLSGFNPRTHTACDVGSAPTQQFQHRFNPRTHTACDSSASHRYLIHHSFNPRTHTACDPLYPATPAGF